MKIPKTFLHCKKNIRSFKRYYPLVILLTFSDKFVLEYKVQNIAFSRIEYAATCHISVALTV